MCEIVRERGKVELLPPGVWAGLPHPSAGWWAVSDGREIIALVKHVEDAEILRVGLMRNE